ncbi:MAG: hypothetical protein JNJ57_20375 [Saprospiraceae bacterium]|nr:hypothetical protein [Saprospiraceae bacterium]
MQSAFTSLLLLLPLWAFTQSCPDFERLMREGNQAKDYEMAFKKYDAADAVACTEALREQARAKKTELFKKINALRRKAEKAQADTKRAEAAARMSEQHTYMAMQALEEEQQKTLIEKNNALEALRLAELMRDSAARANEKIRLANESVVMLILMNDLEALGNIALEKDDFDGARTQYAEVVRRIDLVSVKDSSLVRKGALIREKIKSLDAQKIRADTFLIIIKQADSLWQLSPAHYSAAMELYLYAGRLNWRPEVVCERLSAAEASLQNNWSSVQN